MSFRKLDKLSEDTYSAMDVWRVDNMSCDKVIKATSGTWNSGAWSLRRLRLEAQHCFDVVLSVCNW